MGVLISQTLSEIHFHQSTVVTAQIKFPKHFEHILETCIENNKYFPPLHLSIFLKKSTKKIIDENGLPQKSHAVDFDHILPKFPLEGDHIDHYAWVTLKTYLPVKRIGNKLLKLPRHNDRYGLPALRVQILNI